MLDFDRLPRFKSHRFEILNRIPEWAIAYQVPEEAIERQLGFAHAWCNANPRKAPKKLPIRFLWNWMRKAKQFDNLKVERPRPAAPRAPDPEPTMTVEELVAIRKQNFGEL